LRILVNTEISCGRIVDDPEVVQRAAEDFKFARPAKVSSTSVLSRRQSRDLERRISDSPDRVANHPPSHVAGRANQPDMHCQFGEDRTGTGTWQVHSISAQRLPGSSTT
jgi:hypothetical protein